MAGTSNYPGALDNFSAASPTNLGDDDATGRNHGERHDDLEAAVEAVQGELGVNPAGTATTVVARLDGLDSSKAPVANPTLTGVASFDDGSASAPSITNTGDTNTGVFFPAADAVAISTGGTERVRVKSDGSLLLGVTGERQVGGGFQSTNNVQDIFVESPSNGLTQFTAVLNRNDINSPRLIFGKTRGTTTGSTTAVQNGDGCGAVVFAGADGTDLNSKAAQIEASVDGTVSTGVVPGKLVFYTATTAGTLTERMRLDSNGLITGTGTSLGAWTTYTPTLGGTGWALGNGSTYGNYCQIGKVVYFYAQAVLGSTSTVAAAAPSLTLPVTAVNIRHLINCYFQDVSAAIQYTAAGHATTTTVVMSVVGTNGQHSNPSTTSPFTWASGDVIRIHGFYQAA